MTDPDLTHFAHYFADILLRSSKDIPVDSTDFIMLAGLAIGDLQRGQNGFTAQPLTGHPLANREPEVYEKLYAAVPRLAEEGRLSE